MKKYQYALSIIFIFLYLFFFYLENISSIKYKKASLKALEVEVIEMEKLLMISTDKFYSSTYHNWGLQKNSLLIQREKKTHNVQNTVIKKNQDYKSTKRMICLNKLCWELMGIVTTGKIKSITLLSKNKNSKLKTFMLDDILLDNLKIIEINNHGVILLDSKKEEKIKLKLFDVDISKYYLQNKGKK